MASIRFTALKEFIWRLGGGAGVLVLIVFAFGLGYFLNGSMAPEGPAADLHTVHTQVAQNDSETEVWTCSMHPQVQLSEPGQCPICGMNLIRRTGSAGALGSRKFITSAAAKALMKIQTSLVERRFVPAEIRMVGKVAYDETKLGYITAWVPGRLDRLYVDYTGVEVNKGDHMVFLYSPQLLAGQDELRRAAENVSRIRPDSSETLRLSAKNSLVAAREKLRRWGLTDDQIKQAEKTGISSDHITVYAPMGGTVIHKSGQEGMYVKEGTNIYTIADLSKVWLLLDAYESDLPWLHLGQTVEFMTEAYPGEAFSGKITFINPVLDPITRTVKVRVNVPNEDARLKPEMFARAVVHAQVATGGRVMDPGLAGKWIGPMHPEIVKDGPGSCDICGMPLVRAESLGYVPATASEDDMPLVIPATAPLLTGKRAVVYVELPNQEQPTYEGREIVLGSRTGDYYIVRSGLREGERVVTNGNFKIDSALQIMARPSMMSPEGGVAAPAHHPGAAREPVPEGSGEPVPQSFRAGLRTVVEAYSLLVEALSNDDADLAVVQAKQTDARAREVDAGDLGPEMREHWQDLAERIDAGLGAVASSRELELKRRAFESVSLTLTEAIQYFGLSPGKPVYLANCFMGIDNRSADWLQLKKAITNPYLGEASGMFACGIIKRTLLDEHGHAPHDSSQ